MTGEDGSPVLDERNMKSRLRLNSAYSARSANLSWEAASGVLPQLPSLRNAGWQFARYAVFRQRTEELLQDPNFLGNANVHISIGSAANTNIAVMLYIIGLGLADERDISTKALDIVRRAERVYLEAYTAILLVEKAQLELYYGRSVILADREMVESHSDDILADAHNKDVAFLVVGDPFSATTHTDLALRCRQHSPPIATRTLPNASILTAVGATGLSLYNFGQTVSMVFFTDDWKPDSFYDRIAENVSLGLHTLVLLDIKVKEPDLKALARGKVIYEPPRFMTVAQCASQMLEVEQLRQRAVCGEGNLAIGVARLGSEGEQIVAGTLEELTEVDLGQPLHSLVLCGKKMHEMEWEYAREFAVDKDKFDHIWKRDYAGKS